MNNMREILFRGKKTTNGEWVVGNYNRHPLGSKFDTIEDRENFPYIIYGIVPETVGQYTGLNVNGKRIFEGDIVRAVDAGDADLVGMIKFGMFMWFISGPNWSDSLFRANELHTIEVIGNIHDNPELIAGEEADAHGLQTRS